MKIKFLGTGGAFAPISVGNSNMLLTSESGKELLFDFGTTAPYILRDEWGVDFREIDGIYISHTFRPRRRSGAICIFPLLSPSREKAKTLCKFRRHERTLGKDSVWRTVSIGG